MARRSTSCSRLNAMQRRPNEWLRPLSNLVDLLNRPFNLNEGFSQRRTQPYQFWHCLSQCSGHEPQEILGRTKPCGVVNSLLIPGLAFSLFAGKFAKPDLHKLPDKLTNEVFISAVELFIDFSKLVHRGDAPILVIELGGSADDSLARSACCQFLDNFAEKMFVIAFGRFKLARQVD
jgi:hypothetical protein